MPHLRLYPVEHTSSHGSKEERITNGLMPYLERRAVRIIDTPGGRPVRVWHEVEPVAGDVVTLTETTADRDATVLRVDRGQLRFLDVPALTGFLTAAGFAIDERYGDWQRGPVTDASREIVVVARRV